MITSLSKLIDQYNLPSNTTISGYIIHRPIQNDFLLNFRLDDMQTLVYCQNPNDSYMFEDHDSAQDVSDAVKDSKVCLALDVGNQIAIIEGI